MLVWEVLFSIKIRVKTRTKPIVLMSKCCYLNKSHILISQNGLIQFCVLLTSFFSRTMPWKPIKKDWHFSCGSSAKDFAFHQNKKKKKTMHCNTLIRNSWLSHKISLTRTIIYWLAVENRMVNTLCFNATVYSYSFVFEVAIRVVAVAR